MTGTNTHRNSYGSKGFIVVTIAGVPRGKQSSEGHFLAPGSNQTSNTCKITASGGGTSGGRPWPGLPWAPSGLPRQAPGPQQGGWPHSCAPDPRPTALVRASSTCLGEPEGKTAPHRPPPQALTQAAPVPLPSPVFVDPQKDLGVNLPGSSF